MNGMDWVILGCVAGLVALSAARWRWVRRAPRQRTRWATWRDEPYNPDRDTDHDSWSD